MNIWHVLEVSVYPLYGTDPPTCWYSTMSCEYMAFIEGVCSILSKGQISDHHVLVFNNIFFKIEYMYYKLGRNRILI